ncbi:MAG TPA: DUF6067 family protein [Phycisphaerae bacterium]|nr:DUF6067 family protein [Phycisphaerae bacterium]HQL75538.1 DUF6067 family protein [Phycisphaerae bacterium]
MKTILAGSIICWAALATAPASAADVPYAIADWTVEGWGNSRARVAVEAKAGVVRLHLPWRRRDEMPERKAIFVVDAATGKRLANVVTVRATRESGDVLFQPATAPGEYFVYYMPFKTEGSWYFPSVRYLTPADTAEPAWAAACKQAADAIREGKPCDLPAARLIEFQAVNDFHRFDPMEVIATAGEIKALLAAHAGAAFLLFGEDRRHPIRMSDDLPLRWIQAGPGRTLRGEACRGEFYAFQVGLWACGQDLRDVSVRFGELAGPGGGSIPASALRCFNVGGTDWLGRAFQKTLHVPKGKVQALWMGVQVPPGAAAGVYRGTVTVGVADAPPAKVALELDVQPRTIDDAGDGELWRQARLRWLDSTIGLDDEVFRPFTPVQVDGPAASVLGRRVRLADGGLPAAIQSCFSTNVDRCDADGRDILAAPMRFVVQTEAGELAWNAQPPRVISRSGGKVVWEALSRAGGYELACRASLECDGYMNYELTLTPSAAGELKDIRLEIPLRSDVARYMMGMGRKGGKRPPSWKWTWDVSRSNCHVWIGDVNAGLHLKLKHVTPRWDLFNLKESGLYRDWGNDGKGGCTIDEDGGRVVLRAFTGPRKAAAAQALHFNFGLLVTPIKTLDKAHWDWRYFHRSHAAPLGEIVPTGAKVVNLHQGDAYNPHINYPFLSDDKLKPYIDAAHAAGMKVKLYYTIRELSNYAAEFFALRSLGGEVFMQGEGFKLADQFADKPADEMVKAGARPRTGSSWLCEHAVTDYVPAWHQPLGNARYDAAVATTGLSRWHNYYLQGLDYLVRRLGVDGLYLDGIGYDREIMKRVRKVMQRARPGCLIDFHSGNSFSSTYGLNNVASLYMELFPCIDSLWFGEGFNYNESPDYWLVEMAGIPYGMFSEMLGAGNPWRGMVYGTTNRLGWGGDPREIWKLWDSFGIADARMVGYWDAASPVRTGRDDVLATAYVRKDRTLVALASWAETGQAVKLDVDFKALGLDPAKAHLYAPPVKGFQGEALFEPGEAVPVLPGRGWLLLIDQQERKLPPVHDPFAGQKPVFEDTFGGDKSAPAGGLDPAWKVSLSPRKGTSLVQRDGSLVISAVANSYAFAERPLPAGVRVLACRVNQDSDAGASWGPGLCIVFKDGKMLRVNLRVEGRFGVDDGRRQILEGANMAGAWTDLVFRLDDKHVIVQASQGRRVWQEIARLPRSQFPGQPVAVRVGKMGIGCNAQDFSVPGPAGQSRITDLRAYK